MKKSNRTRIEYNDRGFVRDTLRVDRFRIWGQPSPALDAATKEQENALSLQIAELVMLREQLEALPNYERIGRLRQVTSALRIVLDKQEELA